MQAQGQLTDPYEIMQKSYEALGGLDKFKAEKTRYTEGTLSVAGLEGTFKQWAQPPLRNRTEVDLTVKEPEAREPRVKPKMKIRGVKADKK